MITINLVDNGTQSYAQIPTDTILGHQYDNNAQQITVIKPTFETEQNNTCTMIVSTVSGCYNSSIVDQIVVGDDPIDITDTISQYTQVSISFSFSNASGYIKNSDPETYTFIPTLQPNGWTPTTPNAEQSLSTLLNSAFTSVVLNGNELKFSNSNNQQVQTINIAYPTLISTIAPTNSTVGGVGQFYLNTAQPQLYICTAINGLGTELEPYTYTWVAVG